MSDETGRILGNRYTVGPAIGRGGMAEVYRARDSRLGRTVAVKVLRTDLARDPSFLSRFRREAQAAAGLNHPTIVAVYDSGEDVEGLGSEALSVPYIVMEYVDGQTVREMIRGGAHLSPRESLQLTSGVLDALEYSHAHGIVHRDIKPGNVMRTDKGLVKVMDFGIARALADAGQTMTSSQTVMGTAQYLSPEQAKGETVDARSDLYSTGVVLYEMLTGRPPFIGDSPVSVAYQHVSEDPIPPSQLDPSIPPSVDAIVMNALNKDPEDRYQSAAEFKADVDRAMQGLPVVATLPVAAMSAESTRVMPATRPTENKRRSTNPWIWVLVAVAVLAMLIGGLWLASSLFKGSTAEQVQVPNLVGLTLADAQNLLKQDGLVLGTQTNAHSTKPIGEIIAQDPTPQTTIAKGGAVAITISSGVDTVVVPSLVGLVSKDDAKRQLEQVGLVLGPVTTVPSGQPAGYVVAQDPVNGQDVPVGSTVAISISSGLVNVPDVVGMDVTAATKKLGQAGFLVNVINQQSSAAAPDTVLAQSPRAGSSAPPKSLVTLTVAVPVPTQPPTPTPSVTPTATATPTP
jgi:eukaryotic-like serine/threonine-protein kinase